LPPPFYFTPTVQRQHISQPFQFPPAPTLLLMA